jgi:cytochrome c-type biogenesis protein CcmH/NrfG
MYTKFFGALMRGVTYLLVFLIPLFFLPWTQDVLEPNKQMVLVVLTVIGLAAWLGSMVVQRRFEFRAGLVNSLPAVFLLCVFISSFFSKARYQSWVGQSSQEYVSFLTTALLVCVFYLFLNVHKDVLAQRRALTALLCSATLAGVFSVLQLFHVYLLPFSFAKSIAFNTVGTFNGLTLFLTIVMFLGLALWLVSHEGGDKIISSGVHGVFMRGMILFVSIMSLVCLVAVDYAAFWILVIFGVLLLTSFGFLQTKEFPNVRRFIFPLLLLFVSLFFLFLPSPISLNLPLLVSPRFSATWNIAKSTLSSSVSTLFIGSGPGTFAYQFQLYRPVSLNSSPLWSLTFDRGASAFLTRLSDLGLLGSLAWLLCIAWIGWLAVNRLVNVRNHETWKMTYVLFVGWSLLVASQFLFPSNFTFEFLLWVMSGMLVAHLLPSIWKTDFAHSPKLGLLASFLFVFMFVGMFASVLFMEQKFMGEKTFTKAVALDQKHADMLSVIKTLDKAIQYNALSDVYVRNESFALLTLASQKIQSLSGQKMTDDQTKEISQLVTASVQAASRAVENEPNQVANWEVLGTVYREVMPFAQGAEDLAANAFTNAIKLNPSNPVRYTDLARVYLAVADRAKALRSSKDAEQAKSAGEREQKLLLTAEQALVKAIQLKGDYLPAHYYLAATYEREGKVAEATARLVALTKNTPTDIGLGFELAQLSIRTKKFDNAKQELERILVLNPKHSNALWYLASVYEIQANHEKAIELVRKVVELNPGNKIASERLSKLQAGETTTVLPEPIQVQEGAVSTEPSAPVQIQR